MLITTALQLEALQAEVREAIVHSTAEALALLAKALPTGRPKHNQVLLLTSRAGDIANHEINNTLAPHLLDVLRNELRQDVLTFTDHLTLTDFGPEAPPRPELKPGHLLYKVPPRMTLRQTYECLVRIAHQLSHVLAGVELDDSVTFEALPVAEVMEVEVIDPSPADEPAFNILLLSDGEQLVDEYSATDWVFNIRALREGEHRLVLKISVLLNVGGKERTKNIVLQRPISVTAEEVVAAPAALVRVPDPLGLETTGVGGPFAPKASGSAPPTKQEKWESTDASAPSRSTPDRAGSGDKRPTSDIPEEPPKGVPPGPVPEPTRYPIDPPLVQPQAPGTVSSHEATGRSRRIRYLSIAASILLLFSLAWWLMPGRYKPVDTKVNTGEPIRQPNVSDGPDKVVVEKDSLRRDSLRRERLRRERLRF